MTNERAQTELPSLKACPFCGGDGRVFENPWEDGTWEAQCQTCEGGPAHRMSEAEAIIAWNRRTPSPETPVSGDERSGA
jgi:Lar family restriction alleviation protein